MRQAPSICLVVGGFQRGANIRESRVRPFCRAGKPGIAAIVPVPVEKSSERPRGFGENP